MNQDRRNLKSRASKLQGYDNSVRTRRPYPDIDPANTKAKCRHGEKQILMHCCWECRQVQLHVCRQNLSYHKTCNPTLRLVSAGNKNTVPEIQSMTGRVTVRKSQRTETTQCLSAIKFQKEMWRTSEVNTVQHTTKLWYLLQWGRVLRNPSSVPGANATWYMIPFLRHVLKIQVPGDRKHRATGKGVGVIANEFFSEFG